MKKVLFILLASLILLTACKENNYVITDTNQGIKESYDILVDIKGAVKYPGVYTIASNALIKDVIEIAGGILINADVSKINLVQEVKPNEMIIIPYKNVSNNTSNSKININTASITELMSIPKIGEARAQAIIDYRNSKGSFNSIDELSNVSGISETIISQIKTYITI